MLLIQIWCKFAFELFPVGFNLVQFFVKFAANVYRTCKFASVLLFVRLASSLSNNLLLFACRAGKFTSVFAVARRTCKFAFHFAFCSSHLQVCFHLLLLDLQIHFLCCCWI